MNLSPSSALEQFSHPFLTALHRHQQAQRRRYYLDQHYYKIRQRLLRAARRRAKRRGRPAAPLDQRPGFEAWFGREAADLLRAASRPEAVWRRIPPLSGEQARRLEADLEAINQELESRGMEPARVTGQGSLAWRIHLADYAGRCDLGLFEVSLSADASIHVTGGDYNYGGHIHPHVARDGRLCTGRFEALGDWLHRDGALELVFTTINQILRTYNPASPYVSLEDLLREETRVECYRCGAWVHEDEGATISGEVHCPDCIVWCDGCETYVSIDSEGESFHDRWYCQDCSAERLAHCDHCDRTLLAEDVLESPDGVTWCPQCAAYCAECDEAYLRDDLTSAPDQTGDTRQLCPDCLRELDAEPSLTAEATLEQSA